MSPQCHMGESVVPLLALAKHLTGCHHVQTRVPDHKQQQEGRTAVVMLKRDVTSGRGLPETIATNPVSGPHSNLHQILETSVQPTQRDVRAG
jgi:hypothetical protein